MFAILHTHGPAACPAKSEQESSQFADTISDKSAETNSVKVLHRFFDTNCTGTLAGHLFGALIHHVVLIVESGTKENVQKFLNKLPCEIVGIKPLVPVRYSAQP
jgi:hypothetical protein